jgi:hypothetical protein
MNEPSPAATDIEEQNALALAIVPIDPTRKEIGGDQRARTSTRVATTR